MDGVAQTVGKTGRAGERTTAFGRRDAASGLRLAKTRHTPERL